MLVQYKKLIEEYAEKQEVRIPEIFISPEKMAMIMGAARATEAARMRIEAAASAACRVAVPLVKVMAYLQPNFSAKAASSLPVKSTEDEPGNRFPILL